MTLLWRYVIMVKITDKENNIVRIVSFSICIYMYIYVVLYLLIFRKSINYFKLFVILFKSKLGFHRKTMLRTIGVHIQS